MCFDESNMHLWFSSSNDSSLKCLDLNKRSLDKIDQVNTSQADYELEGLPHINDYHILKNKRYVLTNNSDNVTQVWNIDRCKLVKQYSSKSFSQVQKIVN